MGKSADGCHVHKLMTGLQRVQIVILMVEFLISASLNLYWGICELEAHLKAKFCRIQEVSPEKQIPFGTELEGGKWLYDSDKYGPTSFCNAVLPDGLWMRNMTGLCCITKIH